MKLKSATKEIIIPIKRYLILIEFKAILKKMEKSDNQI